MGKKLKFLLYKPKLWMFVMDTLMWLLSIGTIVFWRYIANKAEILNYVYYFLILYVCWLLVGYFCRKYISLRQSNYITAIGQVFFVSLLLIAVVFIQFWIKPLSLSKWVIITAIEFTAIYNIVVILLYYGYLYALDMDDSEIPFEKRSQTGLVVASESVSPAYRKVIEDSITSYTNQETLAFLNQKVNLSSSTTLILATTESFNVESIEPFHYDQIVNLKYVNDADDINRMFCLMNQRLVDNGLLVCCFRSQQLIKEKILKRYPPVLNWIIYSFHFFFKRACPKMFLTSHLYNDITKGKNRSISQTEVLGRLYYCGFEVLSEDKVGDVSYVTACRKYDPQKQTRRKYGVFIKLNRVGKGGKRFDVYKMRTMHPYSEYLQAYMFEKHNLQEGGKIKDDVRISTLGGVMRKYWIDELPMMINLFKGDMKLVGVRPLSQHYFNLYSPALQEKRTKFKPGLLPPFYADMPKTLDEIQQSEWNYLVACEKHGVLATDFVYFWKIVGNILFHRARSH